MVGGCEEEPGRAGDVSGTRKNESERQKRVEKVYKCEKIRDPKGLGPSSFGTWVYVGGRTRGYLGHISTGI